MKKAKPGEAMLLRKGGRKTRRKSEQSEKYLLVCQPLSPLNTDAAAE